MILFKNFSKFNQFFYFQARLINQKCVKFDYNNAVLISKSRDIFENLSIEEWLFENLEFDNSKNLLIWYNKPCIVLGKHQNPWRETNITNCFFENIAIARRSSGGGTVYHDFENLNLSFLTSKKDYKRKNNLNFILTTIKQNFNINLKINNREDLVFEETNEKVSGTASKLTFNKGYHHCTLLINSDLVRLKKFLRKQNNFISTNATSSIPSEIKNLSQVCQSININKVINVLSNSYCIQNNISKILEIDFDENLFPGILKIKDRLISWDWIFGKTPKFTVNSLHELNNKYFCEIILQKGLIDEIKIHNQTKNQLEYFDLNLIGEKFIYENIKSIINEWIKSNNNLKILLLGKIILDTIRKAF